MIREMLSGFDVAEFGDEILQRQIDFEFVRIWRISLLFHQSHGLLEDAIGEGGGGKQKEWERR